MGTVADFQSIEEEPVAQQSHDNETAEESSASSEEGPDQSKGGVKKKLHRDKRRRVLGGVAAGLGHYFNFDAIWIRLLFIVLCFGLPGVVVIAHIIMWIVVPESAELEEDQNVKKMYRNPEGKVLGGVATGLAAYFGGEVSVVRLLFVISIFIGGSGLILYIILWIVTPEAKSLTEKMQMQGASVTLSNIEQKVKDKLNVKDQEENIWTKLLLFPFRLISALFTALGQILGPAVKFLPEAFRVVISIVLIIVGLAFIFALVISSAVLFGMFAGFEGWVSIGDLPFEALQGSIPTFGVISLFICGLIPALALALLGFTFLFKTTVTNSYVGLALFGMWIIGLIGAGLTIPNMVADFRRSGDVSVTKAYDLKGQAAVLGIREVGIEDYEGVTLTIRGHEDSVYKPIEVGT